MRAGTVGEMLAVRANGYGPKEAKAQAARARGLGGREELACMSVLGRIAFFQGRRDEAPNQQLARTLARRKNEAGIREIAHNLRNPNRNIQSDCLKVLYEVGYLDPALIADYAGDFLALLSSKNNRMVWGSMIALGTIAPLQAEVIGSRLDDVLAALHRGSVITVIWGIRTLAGVAGASRRTRPKIIPHLLRQLEGCLARDLPTHALSCLPVMDDASRARFMAVLERRLPDLSASQAARLRQVMRQAQVPFEDRTGRRSGKDGPARQAPRRAHPAPVKSR